jgi:5-methyltetrahydropteroyltriglutamate--homocysteine methyltransferase
MLSSQDRILVTHTGSLPRPAALSDMYARRASGDAVDEASLDAAGKTATRHVVRQQREAGIDIGNNGEQQREAFFLYVRRRMSGFGGAWTRPPFADVAHYTEFQAWLTGQNSSKSLSNVAGVPENVGEVLYVDPALVDRECTDFQAALDGAGGSFVMPFLTAPSPGIVAAAMRNTWYDSQASYLAALGRALRVEYEAIVRHGFLLQIDAPDLALERHVTYQDRPLREFLDFAEMVVATINESLANVPRDRVRMHVCWGNYEGPHDCDVDLQDILPIIRQVKVGGLVLPFANPRHAHEHRCLSGITVADDQAIVAGVIDPLTNFVEHPEVVADRIEQVARSVGDPTRVLAGTDCGFDTSAGRRRVTPDVVWAKLRTLVEGARIASDRLRLS